MITSRFRTVSCCILLLFTRDILAGTYWKVQDHIALTTHYIQGKYVTLNVNWDPASACRPTVGIVVTNDANLGTYKQAKISTENMVVRIDGKEWSTQTMLVTYTSGIDVMSYAAPELIENMRSHSNSEVHVQVYKRSTIFAFPMAGAKNAIDQAKANCKKR